MERPSDVGARTAGYVLAGIVLVALVLRVVYVLQSRASPLFDAPDMDALYHVEWARALVRGEDYAPGPFFRAPGYPWFLALLTRVFGEGLLAPRLVQAVIGAGSCALVYLLGARLFDRRTGLVAASISAAYAMLVYFEGELLLPVLEVPTALVAVLLAVRYGDRPGIVRVALAGAALGVAAIVRPNILLWGAAAALWIVFRDGMPLRSRFRDAAIYGLATLAPILPITAYNAFAGGDLALISTQGGVNFWIGNNPTSDGSTAIAPGTRPDWWGGFDDTVAQAEAAEGRALSPSEVSQHYSARAWKWIASDPWAAAKHFGWKLRLYWTDHELGNNQDEVFFAREFGPVLSLAPFGFGLVAPLGLLGLALSVRRFGRIGPAWLFAPMWCASVVAFFVCARFRIPMMPVLGVFAAHATIAALDALRSRRWRPLAVGGVAFVGLALLVQAVPARVDRTPAKGLWQLGLLRARAGDDVEAETLLRRSIDANPRFALAHEALGWALLRQKRSTEARASFDAALQLAPNTFGALHGRVEAQAVLGNGDAAIAAAEEYARRAPLNFAAQYTLARMLLAFGGPAAHEVAEATLRIAEARAGDARESFDAAFMTGELERTRGRAREALAAYERALAHRLAPDAEGWFWACQVGRLRALTDLGEVERARAEARALAERWPSDPRAATQLAPWRD